MQPVSDNVPQMSLVEKYYFKIDNAPILAGYRSIQGAVTTFRVAERRLSPSVSRKARSKGLPEPRVGIYLKKRIFWSMAEWTIRSRRRAKRWFPRKRKPCHPQPQTRLRSRSLPTGRAA